MPLEFLLIPADSKLESNGDGAPLEISETVSRTFFCTLIVTDQIEQESLDVSIWGSADGTAWGTKPVVTFPQKFYCGTYQLLLDLNLHPDAKFLRAKWQVSRWGRGDPKPLFGAYLFVQDATKQVAIAKTA